MKTTITYHKDIKLKYELDAERGSLKFDLYNLTPGNIHRICRAIVFEDLSNDDKRIMRNVFGIREDEDSRKKITNYAIDGFRPICNFLKGETSIIQKTESLELLALLIDFQPRPYSNYRTNETNIFNLQDQIEKKRNNHKELIKDTTTKKANGQLKAESKKNRLNKILLVSLIVILSSLFLYRTFENENDKCMVWNGIKYIATDCEPKYDMKYKLPVVPYTEELAKNFKRIEDIDCSTPLYKDGKPIVWCVKVETGRYEFFNSNGKHPITGDSLKKVSDYIREKYICNVKN